MPELDDIRRRYADRSRSVGDRYSFENADVLLNAFHVDRATMAAIRAVAAGRSLADLTLLEVGCGSGGNLLRFLRWGFSPENLMGNELLAERAERARNVLPSATRVVDGDASSLPVASQFDVVYQSTVLSSILDDELQAAVARRMWDLVAPKGAVVSYDFTFDNPQNPGVRKVTVRRLRELFPEGDLAATRVTLAPPLARRTGRVPPLYAALNAVPLLRTHALVTVRKR